MTMVDDININKDKDKDKDNNNNNNSNNNNNWQDKIYNLSGQTIKQSEEELNDLWKEQQQIFALQEIRALKKIKQKKQLLRNQFNKDETSQDNIQRVPIDGDVLRGSKIFMRDCASCHSLETRQDKWQSSSAPSLARIFNKPAASNKLYNNYTDALLRSKIIWNKWNLYCWVMNPQSMVQGTKCMTVDQKNTESIDESKQMNIFIRREIGRSQGSEFRDYTQFAHEKAMNQMKERTKGMILKEEDKESEEMLKQQEQSLQSSVKLSSELINKKK